MHLFIQVGVVERNTVLGNSCLHRFNFPFILNWKKLRQHFYYIFHPSTGRPLFCLQLLLTNNCGSCKTSSLLIRARNSMQWRINSSSNVWVHSHIISLKHRIGKLLAYNILLCSSECLIKNSRRALEVGTLYKKSQESRWWFMNFVHFIGISPSFSQQHLDNNIPHPFYYSYVNN